MKTEVDTLTRPPEETPNAAVKCPTCNDTGFYRPADCSGDPRFEDPDFFILCPYCSAQPSEETREITPPEPPYDPNPKASGYELQIFGIIGVVLLLVAAVVGIVKSISLVRNGVIQAFFHTQFKISLALFAFALLLSTLSILWIVRVFKRKS
ncbi:MAG: hypothetical protein GX417_11160 [Clostridiales bacterium]|nr:hypothetical protein [Clostridiales bacterium]